MILPCCCTFLFLLCHDGYNARCRGTATVASFTGNSEFLKTQSLRSIRGDATHIPWKAQRMIKRMITIDRHLNVSQKRIPGSSNKFS
ncbi:hypothetical protein BT63DRAFT_290897 [Microthyrium microscopicum]|uniref:Secreted protein n=1 Tax=Microthyrium microscopicum TaxID=703497 RepID=A0A6A6U7W8_9PEZI|nr:hypothetical protein BT63DRAFT_290897 [Microthyrium microscopicum]